MNDADKRKWLDGLKCGDLVMVVFCTSPDRIGTVVGRTNDFVDVSVS